MFSENDTSSCKTKYPIILVHGTGSRDREHLSCWGRIPEALRSRGAEVYFSNQDAWGSIEDNALVVKESINSILVKTNYNKVNIIGLSKGGLEARYLISTLGMGDKVASLTTVATPHYGSKTMDFFCGKQKYLLKFSAFFINRFYQWLGDTKPDFYHVCQQLTTAYSQQFNRENLNSDLVYYQSYASTMKKSYSDMVLFIPHAIVKHFDGESDGIVSIGSAKWGEFKGVITGKGIRGISHSDLRDLRRRDSSGMDIRRVYVDIVRDLKNKGF